MSNLHLLRLVFLAAGCAIARATPSNVSTEIATLDDTLTETSTTATQHLADRRFHFSQTLQFDGFTGTIEQAQQGLMDGLTALLDMATSHRPGSFEGLQITELEVDSRRLSSAPEEAPRLRATFEVLITGSAFAEEIFAAAREITPFALVLRDLDRNIDISSVAISSTDVEEVLITSTAALPAATTPQLGAGVEEEEDGNSAVMFGLLAAGGAVFACAGAAAAWKRRVFVLAKKSDGDSDIPNNDPIEIRVDSIRNDLDFDMEIDMDSHVAITVMEVNEVLAEKPSNVGNSSQMAVMEWTADGDWEKPVRPMSSEWSGPVGSERSEDFPPELTGSFPTGWGRGLSDKFDALEWEESGANLHADSASLWVASKSDGRSHFSGSTENPSRAGAAAMVSERSESPELTNFSV